MDYDKAFDNFAKALNQGFTPDQLGNTPNSVPRKIDVPSETLSVADGLRVGSIAGYPSNCLLDKKEHFPVITHTQAQSSMARVLQLTEVPSWYSGSLNGLRQEVYAGIMTLHPNIQLNVRVSAETAVALSDGETSAVTSKTQIKDPEDDRKKNEVPQVARPTLTSAQVEKALQDTDNRKAVAGRLMEMVNKQIEDLQFAKKIASRLLKNGLKSEEFDTLSTYVQEDILRELMSRGATASSTQAEDRRQELLVRMSKNNG